MSANLQSVIAFFLLRPLLGNDRRRDRQLPWQTGKRSSIEKNIDLNDKLNLLGYRLTFLRLTSTVYIGPYIMQLCAYVLWKTNGDGAA